MHNVNKLLIMVAVYNCTDDSLVHHLYHNTGNSYFSFCTTMIHRLKLFIQLRMHYLQDGFSYFCHSPCSIISERRAQIWSTMFLHCPSLPLSLPVRSESLGTLPIQFNRKCKTREFRKHHGVTHFLAMTVHDIDAYPLSPLKKGHG